jgi:hypothetical protein
MSSTDSRVVFFFGETAVTLLRMRAFVNIDLPAFGVPNITTRKDRCSGGVFTSVN